MTHRLEGFDVVADDLDNPERRNGEDHAGYSPYQVAYEQYQDSKNRMNVDLRLHDQRRDDIKLNRLDQCIGRQHTQHHVEASALRKGHETGQRTARHISDKRNDFQDPAKDGEKDGIVDAYQRKS